MRVCDGHVEDAAGDEVAKLAACFFDNPDDDARIGLGERRQDKKTVARGSQFLLHR